MPGAASAMPAAASASRLATTVPRQVARDIQGTGLQGVRGRPARVDLWGQCRPRLLQLPFGGQRAPDRVDHRSVEGGTDRAVQLGSGRVPLRRCRPVGLDRADSRRIARRRRCVELAVERQQQPARQQEHPAERFDEARQGLPDLLLLGRLHDVAHGCPELLAAPLQLLAVEHARALRVREDEILRTQGEGLEQARDEGHPGEQLGVDPSHHTGRFALLDHRVDREAVAEVSRHAYVLPRIGWATRAPGAKSRARAPVRTITNLLRN